MSSRSSNSPAAEVEEPRKKGSKGGKRSVTHLSKAQLARKRANDREAQRNIRQRTKEHIENLEKKVKELEGGSRSSSMDRVLQRNQELEAEIDRLRSQLSSTTSTPSQIPIEISDELYIQPKNELEWMPEPSHGWRPAQMPGSNPEIPTSMGISSSAYVTEGRVYSSTPASMGYDHELYAAIPIWNENQVFGGHQLPQSFSKGTPTWTPFHPAFSQPSRFPDLQQTGFTEMVNSSSSSPNSSVATTAWQSQPSVHCWQFSFSTKLKQPVTYVDSLMLSIIQTQRSIVRTSELTGQDTVGTDFPSVHVLFNQPGPVKPPSCLTEVMERYAAVLSTRGFALIPEKLASFMCMFRFIQWQIAPNLTNYQMLKGWQAPRPSQLEIPHPAWQDLIPWGDFRDMVIKNQDRYDNPEFQNDYASNLSVNFPYDPMKALVFENNQILISKLLDAHISDITNMSMKKAFADKYPEFKDVCRFDEV